jgi:hypothetical protein
MASMIGMARLLQAWKIRLRRACDRDLTSLPGDNVSEPPGFSFYINDLDGIIGVPAGPIRMPPALMH